MDVKELDKRQLILLTLLITFVVSIGTGIVTVSLMKQMPKSVPQTINNVIQRTIEKVSTVEVPTTKTVENDPTVARNNTLVLSGGGDALVNIYSNSVAVVTPTTTDNTGTPASTPDATSTSGSVKTEITPIGQGIIISDIGLILVDSSIISDQNSYKVVLNKIDFNASVLKKFGNGFTVLKISPMTDKTKATSITANKTQ